MGRWVVAALAFGVFGCDDAQDASEDPAIREEFVEAPARTSPMLMQASQETPTLTALERLAVERFDPRAVMPSPAELDDFAEHYWKPRPNSFAMIAYRPDSKLTIEIHPAGLLTSNAAPPPTKHDPIEFGFPPMTPVLSGTHELETSWSYPIAQIDVCDVTVKASFERRGRPTQDDVDRALEVVTNVAHRTMVSCPIAYNAYGLHPEIDEFVAAFDAEAAGPLSESPQRLDPNERWKPMAQPATSLEAGCEPVVRASMSGFALRPVRGDLACSGWSRRYVRGDDSPVRWTDPTSDVRDTLGFALGGSPDGSFVTLRFTDDPMPDLDETWSQDDRGLGVDGFVAMSRVSTTERSEVEEFHLSNDLDRRRIEVQFVLVSETEDRQMLIDALNTRIDEVAEAIRLKR